MPIGGEQFLLPLVSLSVSSNSALLPDWTMPIGGRAIPLTFAKSFCDIKQWQPSWLDAHWGLAIPLTFSEPVSVIK